MKMVWKDVLFLLFLSRFPPLEISMNLGNLISLNAARTVIL